jgi:hypothetical protein
LTTYYEYDSPMDFLPVPVAANRLGVSNVQVQRLIGAGDLRARRFGRAWAVEAASVNERIALRPQRGRPLSGAAAWDRLLSPAPPLGLEGLGQVAVAVRRRATLHRCRVIPGEIAAVAEDARAVLGGPSGAAAQGAAAAGDGLDVYVMASQWPALAADHHLDDRADEPNVYVRVVDDECWPFGEERVAPLLACAVDSYERLDQRSAHEALVAAAR